LAARDTVQGKSLSDKVVIFAAEGVMAQEAVETLARLDIPIAAAVVTADPEWDMSGLSNIIDVSGVSDRLAEFPVVIPVWGPKRRRAAMTKAVEAGFSNFMTLVDPSAVVARSARLGKGVSIMTGANVGAGVTIGDFALINRGALIGHHCHLGAFVTTGGGVTLASRCQISDDVVLGAGCVLIPNRIVGASAVVGAGAVVIRDVAAGTTVAGNPARVIKEG
jgi:sugar O-acyltransferase (sialic acid O-acetyltransferase NeuD family)